MPTPLPDRPSLDQLKNQAKDLQKGHKAGDPEALRRIQANHPRLAGSSARDIQASRFTLSGAQLVIAREYGFSSWPKLKAHVESLSPGPGELVEQFTRAIRTDDATGARHLLEAHPMLREKIDEPLGPFDSPVVTNVRSREMLDVLLAAGANLNAKSRWWAGGFGILHSAGTDLAAYAIERGAIVDVHAAARLGLLDRLRELVEADPELVHARGGDGQTPLHFAATVEIARYLLDHGALLDTRDLDHESTPAQWMLDDRLDVARYLVARGCQTDLLMAAALGDLELSRRHLDANPDCIRLRVSEQFFPMVNPKAGGTIYYWKLGWYVSPHQVARKRSHGDILRLLQERSPTDVRLIEACWMGDEAEARAIRREHPEVVLRLTEADRRLVAHAARNNEAGVVRLMLECGWPVDARGQHQGTPLHWAAFHGNDEMARAILGFGPPLEVTDADFHGTPLGWAIHGSEHGWHCKSGRYAATVEALLKAGAKVPDDAEGTEPVREVLRRYGANDQSA
jgi:ankyrin repeat protein